MLRRNVLVDLGESAANWASEVVVAPEAYKRLNNTGKILSVANQCEKLTADDIGKQAFIRGRNDVEGRLMDPAFSRACGLVGHWHVILHEQDVIAVVEP